MSPSIASASRVNWSTTVNARHTRLRRSAAHEAHAAPPLSWPHRLRPGHTRSCDPLPSAPPHCEPFVAVHPLDALVVVRPPLAPGHPRIRPTPLHQPSGTSRERPNHSRVADRGSRVGEHGLPRRCRAAGVAQDTVADGDGVKTLVSGLSAILPRIQQGVRTRLPRCRGTLALLRLRPQPLAACPRRSDARAGRANGGDRQRARPCHGSRFVVGAS